MLAKKTLAKKSCKRSPMARANKLQPHSQSRSVSQAQHLDERLDAALIETFPASDPIAVGRPTATEPSRRAGDRPSQGGKARGASQQALSRASSKASSTRATAMPAARKAGPSKKGLRDRP